MATAIETTSEQRTPSSSANLLAASVAGAVYVLASLAIVFFVIPGVVRQALGVTTANIATDVLIFSLEAVAFVALILLGRTLAGKNPPKGLRGGIFLVLSALFANFFLIRAVGLNVSGPIGMAVTALIGVGLIVLTVKFLVGSRGERAMIALEHSGFFSTSTYKSMLGQKVRRLTICGILLVGGTGVWCIWNQGLLTAGDWVLALPFTDSTVTLLPSLLFTGCLLLLLLTGWVAWRVTNMPTFAEFLIATEAEMNKVSWSTRKQLTQDTIVVLVTTFLMTAFLFLVDVFWGWLLSQSWIGVLPGKSETNKAKTEQQAPKW